MNSVVNLENNIWGNKSDELGGRLPAWRGSLAEPRERSDEPVMSKLGPDLITAKPSFFPMRDKPTDLFGSSSVADADKISYLEEKVLEIIEDGSTTAFEAEVSDDTVMNASTPTTSTSRTSRTSKT